jgi:hypothetical protein
MNASLRTMDPADDLLAASQSPWIKLGGGTTLLAGVVGIGIGVQSGILFGDRTPAYLFIIAGLLVLSALACFPTGFGTFRKSERHCAAAVVSTGLLSALGAVWAVLLFVNGVFSLMSMALPPLALLALLASVLALSPVRRASRAMAALSA